MSFVQVQLGTVCPCLDNDQLDAHLLYFTIRLLYSSTCFQALHAHHQEAKLYRCSIWYRPLHRYNLASS